MFNLLAQDAPPDDLSILTIMVWPVAMTLLGGLIFYFGWWYENRMSKAPWKWIAFAPLAYGLLVGWGYMSNIMNPWYQAAIPGISRKLVAAHYGAFILPALGVIGVLLFHFFNHKLHIAVDD